MTAVPVRTSPTLEIGRPVALFRTDPPWLGFDATPDGKRFLAIVPEIVGNRSPATVVVNGASAPPRQGRAKSGQSRSFVGDPG